VKLVLAPASFKESMTARQAALAMQRGARVAVPDALLVLLPIADGGEGTLDALVFAAGGSLRTIEVTGPRGVPVQARIGTLPDGTAVVEAAEACGIGLLPLPLRDPRLTTSRGVGEMLSAALDSGASRVLVGLGGSGTNDAGAGLLQALGASLLDDVGRRIGSGGAALARLARIDLAGLDPRLARIQLDVACDVTSPLCGPEGATAVFAPQKGASPEAVAELEASLGHFAAILERDTGRRVGDVPGAGAAGGLGAALLLCGARLVSGIDLVLDAVGFDAALAGACAVLTGEGSLDGQTARGKAIGGLAARAASRGVAVIALAGRLGVGYERLYERGLTAALPIAPGPHRTDDALLNGAVNLERATRDVVRLLYALA
jgi:glycerate kinase